MYYTHGDGTGRWHSQTIKRFRNLSKESLRYIILDCREVLEAMPDNPKAGQYQDEISYAGMELKRRQSLAVCFTCE
jgi:hypothetical protein